MTTAQPAAAAHAPVHGSRATVEDSAVEESLQHHAMRSLRSRLGTMACGALDPCIALLRRLRKGAGGAQDADAEAGEDEPRHRNAGPGGRPRAAAPRDEDEDAVEAPEPKHRLRAALIYLGVLIAGGMAGGALAYELLAKLLDRQAAESRSLETAMAKQSKSFASYQKNLDEAEPKRVEAEKKLDEAQKKQIEAEKKLEVALNDTKAAAEKQKKLDEAVRLLETIRGADRSSTAQRAAPVSTERNLRAPKSGDCTLETGNVDALKGCIKDFNR